LTKFVLHAVPGQALLDAVAARFKDRSLALNEALNNIDPNSPDPDQQRSEIERDLEALNQWAHSYDHIGSGWPAIRADVAFTDINYEYDSWVGSVDLFELEGVTGAAYLAFDPGAVFADGLLLSHYEVETSTLLDLATALGIIEIPSSSELEVQFRDLLTSNANDLSRFAGRYLGEALARLCHPNAIFLDVTADFDNWTVKFLPLTGDGIGGGLVGGSGGASTFGTFAGTAQAEGQAGTAGTFVGSGEAGGQVIHGLAASPQVAAVPGSGPISGDTPADGGAALSPIAGSAADVGPAAAPAGSGTASLGILPAEFKVVAPASLAALDEIQTIVVVMMENRSFDHMLGYLRQLHPRPAHLGYEGFSGEEINNVHNVHPGFKMQPATRANIPDPVTAIYPGPEHGFSRVKGQVADGQMSGFAQDYEDRYPDDGIGQWVLTYYTDKELPTYYRLAADYAVCDHWFASHPGSTWPNRWVTMSGSTPFLENPDVGDPAIGFLHQTTIFDLLTRRGIEWRVFESDLSLIRTFDNFRLDADRVIPYTNYDDQSRSFEDVARAGALPPVVFVEPNFSDVPPLSTADDDLCPVDLAKGQDFVARVYAALQKSPQWPRTLMLVTYDEHGGFFDHVPPPGTPLGPPEWIGKVPRVHPDGADHLGVRVPALVVSPWVTPGSVCKQVFDHTTIIKTILLRHRAKFETPDFVTLGHRVNQAAHLGIALNQTPITDPNPEPMQPRLGGGYHDAPPHHRRQI
jgi:phospholipase C